MKLVRIAFAVTLVTFFAFVPGKEKKKSAPFQGKITYSMTYEDLPPELEQYSSMLPKEMTMYLKEDHSRIEQNSAMGTTITLFDKKKQEMYILLDMMGSKVAYKGGPDDMKDTSASAKPEVKLLEETKDIAGKKCNKAEITYPGKDPQVVWYTKDLPSGLNKNFDYLEGFPMEYHIERGGMVIQLTVTSVKEEKVSSEYFKVPAGYEVKPISEMNALGGGK